MTSSYSESDAANLSADNDRKNLGIIENARVAGRINAEAAAYLSELYSDSILWFREVFYFLGNKYA